MARRIRISKRDLARLGAKAGPRTVVPEPELDTEPGPRVVCKGVVHGRAVPWKAPRVNRNGEVWATRGYKNYVDWLATVARQVRLDMGRRRMYGGPVEVEATFYLHPAPSMPDRINLMKAFEDAIQGVVYPNDTMVCGGEPRRVVSAFEDQRVEYEVRAI